MPSEDQNNDDQFLRELLDEVLEDHKDLPPEVLNEMRWVLELAAKTHPTASTIVNRARPREVPKRSGDQAKPDAAPLADADDSSREGTGG